LSSPTESPNCIWRLDSSEHLDPVVSNDVFAPPAVGRLSTPIEVFCRAASSELAFMQIRSCALPGHVKPLAAQVLDWAAGAGFERVVVVGGASAMALTSQDMFESRDVARLLVSSSAESDAVALAAATKFASCTQDQLDFAGLTKPMLSMDTSIPVLALVRFVFEGDNFDDGVLLARDVARLLDLSLPPDTIKEPLSWNVARGLLL